LFLYIVGLESHCVEKYIHVLILGGRGLEILEQVEPLTEFCGFILGYLSFVLEVNFVPHQDYVVLELQGAVHSELFD